MKYFILPALVFTAAALILVGCENSVNEPVGAVITETDDIGAVGTINARAPREVREFCGDGNLVGSGEQLELWAGVGNVASATLVGYVSFDWSIPYYVGVTYNFTDADGIPGPDIYPWVVSRIHFDIGADLTDIPVTKSGNPVPGAFDYGFDLDPYVTSYSFQVALPALPDGKSYYYVAAHASIFKYGGVEGFNFYLPNNQVTLRVIDYPSAGDPSYFKLKVTNGGFISTYDMGYGPGVYEGWCIDVDHTIGLNTNYPAYLFSSYETLPSWLVGTGNLEYPENLDKVNYLVNYFKAGDLVQPMNADCTPRINSSTGLPYPPEALTYSDIQRAIWGYVDDNQSTSGLTNYSQFRVNAIKCATDASGEGFIPGCDQKIVFIVVPTGTTGTYNIQLVIGQPVIGEIEIPCETMGKTAWADGRDGAYFPGARQWGTYFKLQQYCPAGFTTDGFVEKYD